MCFRVLPRMQPPTYEVDGFTHATADPSFLIGVANHFYKTTQPEWICLGMSRASLAAAQITMRLIKARDKADRDYGELQARPLCR